MTLPRRALRIARPVVETVLAGLLVGVVVVAFAAQLSPSPSTTGPASEVPLARNFMLALIHDDTDTLARLYPTSDVLSQAIAFQKLASDTSTVRFPSLTFLGTSAVAGLGVHLYAVQVDGASGTRIAPFAVTLYQGRVVDLRNLAAQPAQ